MEKQLLELFQRAKKAADVAVAADGEPCSSPEEERCLDALERLKQLPITRDVLVSSKIGRNLRQLTKHPRKRIQALASSVMPKWMGIFDPSISKSRKEEKSKSDSDSKKQGKQLNPTVAAVNSPRGMSTSLKTGDKNRDKIRELLAEALGKVGGEVAADGNLREEVNQCDPHRVAAMVETALFKNWGLFHGDKKAKYRSLMFNIKDANNPDFRRKVLLGHFTPATIIGLSTEDMASDDRKMENKRIKEKALYDCELVQSVEASTLEIKCGKCRKTQTTYHQMQTRRADEPMTTFVTCLNCGHHWKFS